MNEGKGLQHRGTWIVALVMAFSLCFCESASSAVPAGRPVRVAYIEGGFYPDFPAVLVALAQGLEELGIIPRGAVPVLEQKTSTRELWQWLADHAGGTAITFVADAHYTAQWDTALLEKQKNALVQRIAREKDIDMVLVLGTKAGQVMASTTIDTPLIIFSATDAVTTGLVASAEDSGRDNIFALVEENRYYRELMLFHDIFKFTKLGVSYEDTPEGRGAVALAQIEKAASDANFALLTCKGIFFGEASLALESTLACHKEFAQNGADAVYMTASNGLLHERMSDILRPLLAAGLPTFSQSGTAEVKLGALLSVSQESFKGQGMFVAKAIANIIDGQSPRAQKQIHEEPLSLTINLYTAMRIGWTPSLAVLAAVDTFFER